MLNSKHSHTNSVLMFTVIFWENCRLTYICFIFKWWKIEICEQNSSWCNIFIFRKLRTDVKRIRMKGVIKAGHDPMKTCARCREPFGWLFNKGSVCPKCQHKVCDKCRQTLSKDSNAWVCVLCFKMKYDVVHFVKFNLRTLKNDKWIRRNET